MRYDWDEEPTSVRHYVFDGKAPMAPQVYGSDDYHPDPLPGQPACAGTDPLIFFPPKGSQLGASGLRVCRSCEIRDYCREANVYETEGIWGGTTEKQRRRLREHTDMKHKPRGLIPRPMRTQPLPHNKTQPPVEQGYMKRKADEPGHKWRKPSDDFDWDRAFTLNAITLRDLGYDLTPQQQKRVDDHERTV